jgi:hypothetical protein
MEPLLRAAVWLVLVLVVAAHFAFLVYLPSVASWRCGGGARYGCMWPR